MHLCVFKSVSVLVCVVRACVHVCGCVLVVTHWVCRACRRRKKWFWLSWFKDVLKSPKVDVLRQTERHI